MSLRIIEADVREGLGELTDQSVQCCVTSPPYYGLRDYGVPGQLGMEPTLAEYITAMVEVFRDVRRVLRDDGTLFLNVGDSYNAYNANRGRSNGISGNADVARPVFGGADGDLLRPNPGGDEVVSQHRGRSGTGSGGPGLHELERGLTEPRLKPKDLMMVPARLAIALQDDGWYLRSDIIWHKPNPMPESVQDRPTSAHEHIFLLTKNRRYYYDADAIRTESTALTTKMPDGWDTGAGAHGSFHRNGREKGASTLTGGPRKNPDRRPSRGVEGGKQRGHGRRHEGFNDRWDAMPREEQVAGGANARNVWTIATKGFSGAHFAVFPEELARRCIAAGTKQGDVVLDPFLGSGTTLLVADRLGRDGIGIELNPTYAAMARRRIEADCPLFVEIPA